MPGEILRISRHSDDEINISFFLLSETTMTHLTRTTELQIQHPDFATVFGTIVELYHLIETLLVEESYPVIWARNDTAGWDAKWEMIFDGWPQDLDQIERHLEEYFNESKYETASALRGNYEVLCEDEVSFRTDDIDKAQYWESRWSDAYPGASFMIREVDTGNYIIDGASFQCIHCLDTGASAPDERCICTIPEVDPYDGSSFEDLADDNSFNPCHPEGDEPSSEERHDWNSRYRDEPQIVEPTPEEYAVWDAHLAAGGFTK